MDISIFNHNINSTQEMKNINDNIIFDITIFFNNKLYMHS